MIAAWLAFVDALLALALVLVGVLGAHFQKIAPFVGFQFFVLGFLLSVAAVLLGVIGVFATRNPLKQSARPRAVIGTVIGLVIALPVLTIIYRTRGYPAINDITTDIANPPEFVHAPALGPNHGRDMKYDRARYAAAQQQGYGALAPLKMPSDPDDVFKHVRAVAAQMPNWRITYVDPASRTLEGVATSNLFRFKDDFVIQVRPAEGGMSLVEMRSKSRHGVGDFGANYHRIEAFFARVQD
jgi:uncharacterized protein (DUF1499 family)